MGITFTSEGAIGTITLDSPPANSYHLSEMQQFAAAVEEVIARAGEIRVVRVRSASEKFFCAGADIKRFLEGDIDANMQMIRTSQAAFKRMAGASAVFVAEIAGHALGGGLELTLACDLRYAKEGRYQLGTPEVTLGILPGNGGTQRLPRLIGASRAMELLITGRTFTADQAVGMGLVHGLFPADTFEADVEAAATRLAGGPPLAIAAIKRCVQEGGQLSLDDGLLLEAELIEMLFRSADGSEGLTAFVEKRPARFEGA
jgi:enoyl-CoA hydratase/carnithine racemase